MSSYILKCYAVAIPKNVSLIRKRARVSQNITRWGETVLLGIALQAFWGAEGFSWNQYIPPASKDFNVIKVIYCYYDLDNYLSWFLWLSKRLCRRCLYDKHCANELNIQISHHKPDSIYLVLLKPQIPNYKHNSRI